jgi:nitrate/nitrite transporter NarK
MVSRVAGIQNSVSNMGGVVGPIVTGAIVGSTGSFVPALMFSSALIVIAMLNYLFLLGRVEPIQFNQVPMEATHRDERNVDARA